LKPVCKKDSSPLLAWRVLREGVDCQSNSLYKVGDNIATLDACARAVKAHNRRYFQYGFGSKAGHCFIYYTTADCPSGFEADDYNWYELEEYGALDPYKAWRLEDPFVTGAAWHTIRKVNNEWTQPITFQYTLTMGYSENFQKSSATSTRATKAIKKSAGLSFKYLNLGRSHEKTATSEFNSAVTAATSESYTMTNALKFTVQPDQCVELRQLKVVQDDKQKGVEGMVFHSAAIWIFDCKNHTEDATGTSGRSVCKPGCEYDPIDGCVCKDVCAGARPKKKALAGCARKDEPYCATSDRVQCDMSYYKEQCCTFCASQKPDPSSIEVVASPQEEGVFFVNDTPENTYAIYGLALVGVVALFGGAYKKLTKSEFIEINDMAEL
jgi:hypothetical protein